MFTTITPPSSSSSSSSSSSTLLLLLLSSMLVLTASTEQLLCHEDDLRALLEIKRSLGNPSILSSWNESIPCCQWYNGVYCDADGGGRVTLFTLQYTNVTAAIPPAIGRLSRLRFLLIVGNPNLFGTIPSSLGYLKNLTYLRISENPLVTGTIPSSLCRLSKLEELRLNLNGLTGLIPACLGQNISYIDFSSNSLSGQIPGSFLRGSTAPSITLDLSGNRLTGAIPESLGDVPLEVISLSGNKFTDASVLFGEEKKTKTMDLARNELKFEFSKVRFPLGLESLTVDHNRLTGSIAQQIVKLEKLTQFDVSYNYLCGPIPTGKYLKTLLSSSFIHNKCLCGLPLKPCHK